MSSLSYIATPLRRLTVGLAIAFTLLLGVLAALVGSQAGTRLLGEKARAWLGDDVRWDSLDGRLTGPLRINGLAIAVPGTRIEVGVLELDWSPRALLGREVRVTRLLVADTRLDMDDSTPPAEPTAPFDPEALALPVDVRIDSLALRELSVYQAGALLQRVESIDARAHWVADAVTIEHLAVRAPEGGASLRLDAAMQRAMPLALEATWDWAVPPIDVDPGATPPPTGARLNGQLRVTGHLDWADDLGIALDYALRGDGLHALQPDLPETVRLTGRLDARSGAEIASVDSLSLQLEETTTRLQARGRVTGLADDAPVADLTLNWEDLRWPLQANAPLAASPRGELHIQGTATDYRLELAAAVEGEDLPAGAWQLSAAGDAEHLVLAPLRGEVLGGTLEGRGRLGWAPLPAWQLELRGEALDPAALDPALTGIVAFAMTTEGTLDPDTGPSAQLVVREFGGTVSGRPLAVTVAARIDGETVMLGELNARSEDNVLRATGSASEAALDLQWTLNVPNPGALLPGAAGRLGASGTLTGSIETPALTASLEGQDLLVDDLRLARIDGHARLGLDPAAPLTLRLSAGELFSGDEPLLTRALIDGSGTLGKHTVSIEGDTPAEHLALRLSGAADLEAASWQGDIEALTLVSEAFGRWRLRSPTVLAYSGERMALGSGCLDREDGPGALCVAGERGKDGATAASLQLDALPIEAFVSSITGSLVGAGELQLAQSGDIRARLDLALSPGDVLVPVDGDTQRLAHQGGIIDLRVDADGLTSRLDFAAPEAGTVNATIALPGFHRLPLADEQPLAGHVTMALPRLAALESWVSDVSEIDGRLEGDIRLGGSITAPLIDGGLALRDGMASVPAAGLRLTDVTLEVSGDSDAPGLLNIAGGLRSGEGSATLAGTFDTRTTALALSLEGDRLTVYDTPDARAYLSPDLTIGWSDDTLRLRGDLLVPEASITPQLQLRAAAASDVSTAPSAPGQVLAPSPDVVIINANPAVAVSEELEATAPFRIDSRIRLALGDAVKVRALGFKSRIDGAVTFTNPPGRDDLIPIADGSLNIRDGTFLAFGQDLEIETGQLIFARVPATEPELNVRAVRWIANDPQVTAAGVLVTGPATQPVLELFSRPQLDIAEIQSYLLTGTSAAERSSVLAVGTYLTPRLYVGYGYNVLESTSEFNSLFSVTPRYGFSANAGDTDSNVNLTVTYEH